MDCIPGGTESIGRRMLCWKDKGTEGIETSKIFIFKIMMITIEILDEKF
jgi:hypothetical protein